MANLLVFSLLAIPVNAISQTPDVHQIVTQLVGNNQRRAALLRHYEGCRLYLLDYTGFPSSKTAEMVVDMKYDAPDKQFRVVRETGARVLLNRVLKELLVSEKEASDDQHRSSSALTPENYEFKLLGTDTISGRPQFTLEVTPRSRDKFLYKGKIWVDATDYAISRIVAEPAKNPSFWISHTEIEHDYKKVGEFWLPERNVSVTKVRLGGTAKLSIQYLNYVVGTSENTTNVDVCSNLPRRVQVSERQ
ncbi:MAG TPA: hypothetical protein VFB24_02525 [Candidatus Binatia bacterium]|jgi:hypothetical protein|nr:hypothetical protein [Candidatus Binatia bacterium]